MLASSQEITRFLQHVPDDAPRTALDIGCGTGQLSRELYHRGYRVVGVDASSSAITIARSLTTAPAAELRYIQRDVERTRLAKLPRRSYGLITCRLVFAFITDKGQFLRAVANVLAPKGALVIITPLLGHVPEQKRAIAVDPSATQALLEEFFAVEFYEERGEGVFICRHLTKDRSTTT